MKQAKHVSVLTVFVLFIHMLIPALPGLRIAYGAEPVQAVAPLIFDDFSDNDRFQTQQKNAMGGGYWGNGLATSSDGVATLNGTTWWDTTLGADEPETDLRNYTWLEYRVKASAGATMTVNLWNQFGSTDVPVPLTETWQTVRIPLTAFTGLDTGRVKKMKHSISAAAVVEIDDIRFVAADPLVVDNFDSAAQFADKKTDLGGNYDYDGTTTSCDGTTALFQGTWWLAAGLGGPQDIRNFTHLTLEVRGAEAMSLSLKLENHAWGTVSSSQSADVTTQWQTLQIPLADFTGLDAEKALAVKLEGMTGALEIRRMAFEALAVHSAADLPTPDPTPTPEPETPPANTTETTYIDDFNSQSKLEGPDHGNDMGGRYWGDGTWTCDGNKATISNAWWWNVVLRADSSGTDLSGFEALTFVIRGNAGASANVKLKDTAGNSSPVVNIPVSTSWRTVQLPMAGFTGVDLTGITELDCTFPGADDAVSLDEIRLDRHLTPPAPTPVPVTMPGTRHPLTTVEGPDNNPLKGFFPFAPEQTNDSPESFTHFPHSMEWCYFPLKDVMTGDNTFDFSRMETALNLIASRGHQAAFRIYLDYPDTPSGIPQFLLDAGLKTHSYSDYGNGAHATSLCPDYNDPLLMTALEQLIHALGQKYDGDPRVGFVTTGLVGFWGEWHTYPYNGSEKPQNWMPSTANINTLLQAFDDAFNQTKILTRYPMGISPSLDMGYHDDSFAYSTLPVDMGGASWHFYPALNDAGVDEKWQTQPTGGELRPEIQRSIWDSNPPGTGDAQKATGAEDFNASVDITHASWMISHAIFKTPLSEAARANALAGARRMGYTYAVDSAWYDRNQTLHGTLEAGVQIQNTGTAPFYYPWTVRLGLMKDGVLADTWDTDWDISGIQPGTTTGFRTTHAMGNTGSGDWTLVMKVLNPLSALTASNGKALPFLFANAEQGTDGWLTLGQMHIAAAPAGGGTPGGDTPGSTPSPSDGQADHGVVTPVTEKTSDGTVRAQVGMPVLDKAFEQASPDAGGLRTVVIEVPGTPGGATYVQQLPAAALTSGEDLHRLEIRTPVATLTVPRNMLGTASAGGDRVELSLAPAETAGFSDAVRQLVGTRPVVELNLKVNGEATGWSNPGAPVTVSVPFVPGEAERSHPECVVVYYIDGHGRATPVPGSHYDAAGGRVTFTTTHFSTYALGFAEKHYRDTETSPWAVQAVEALAVREVFTGTSADTFGPEEHITRGAFTGWLIRTSGLSAATSGTGFEDVAPTDTYASEIATAKALGIAAGYQGAFRPGDTLTRQDMMVLLAKVLAKKGVVLSGTAPEALSAFSDAGEVAGYAAGAAATLVQKGYVRGDGRNLMPQKALTRAEAAQVLYNLFLKP